jgi:hypothetical protein
VAGHDHQGHGERRHVGERERGEEFAVGGGGGRGGGRPALETAATAAEGRNPNLALVPCERDCE